MPTVPALFLRLLTGDLAFLSGENIPYIRWLDIDFFLDSGDISSIFFGLTLVLFAAEIKLC